MAAAEILPVVPGGTWGLEGQMNSLKIGGLMRTNTATNQMSLAPLIQAECDGPSDAAGADGQGTFEEGGSQWQPPSSSF